MFHKDLNTFFTGCNYVASHAGLDMWVDWQPDIIAEDISQLAAIGTKVLRVFPIWRDFQPIHALYGIFGELREFRWHEQPLDDSSAGQVGVSIEMIQRFQIMADMAAESNLKLIVSLVNGWMSGRLFVPPGLEGRNFLTDPLAIKWQVRFVKYFVEYFKNHPSIIAWDLGNECNCLAHVDSANEAWRWTANIADAIRSKDSTRPIISGMHALTPNRAANWKIQHQAELVDILTTHPYPMFTPHCDLDPVNTIRPGLHATAETRFYADIASKPCFTEEIGTLGPMVASEKNAADFLRMSLFSLWANDCGGLLWWCAYDLNHKDNAPYDWCAYERELGMIRRNRQLKPVMEEMIKFREVIESLPFKKLPPPIRQAVCILSEDQDTWGVAYSSFVLAKQAGFDIEFQFTDQPLKDASFYMLPSVCGPDAISRRFWLKLQKKVHAGATLYISHDNCMFSDFEKVAGVEIQTRSHQTKPAVFSIESSTGNHTLSCQNDFALSLKPTRAKVIASEDDGNPVFTYASLGQGTVFFLTVPIEMFLSNTTSGFEEQNEFWRIYEIIAEGILTEKVIRKDNPMIAVTEHPLDNESRLAVLINHQPAQKVCTLKLADGWKIKDCLRGLPTQNNSCKIPGNDASIYILHHYGPK